MTAADSSTRHRSLTISDIVPPELADLTKSMRAARTNGPFYVMTLVASEEEEEIWSCLSENVDMAEHPGWEIRQARKTGPDQLLATGWPYLVVHDEAELSVFLSIGGHALIDSRVADEHLAAQVRPDETAPVPAGGYTATLGLPRAVTCRKTPLKTRKKVIERDGNRCKKCGSTPETNEHVELQVHHIRPWTMGGLSDESNLITLCRRCHVKLRPHYQPHLYRSLPEGNDFLDFDMHDQRLLEGVRLYQEQVSGWDLD